MDSRQLFVTFGPLIYSRCRRALRDDEALALSATEEVFVRVRKALETADSRGAVQVLARACEVVCGELVSG